MSFDLQPTLAGKLVTLTPLCAEDFERLYAVASDPLIWEQHPQRNRYQREVFQSYFDGAIKSGGAFLATDTESGEVIGSSRYYDFDAANRSILIGYTFIARKYWGHRHNREMKQLMLEHAFRYVDHVIFHIGENNTRSQKAVQKIGATYVGRIDSNSSEPNKVVYQIDRTSFQTQFGLDL